MQVFCDIDRPCHFFWKDKRQGNGDADRHDPSQSTRTQGQIRKHLAGHFQMGKLMENVNDGTDSRRCDSQTHANTGKADKFIDDNQKDDRNRHRIHKQQERQCHLNNLVQPQIGCCKAE